ncbi:MAG: N-acetylmuramoyl-L-alanine amidase, partial [Alphaproteobacteria bacterium]|nr:N-acetylmuramoyl-L-alanine amidase [Alphaproteobacteria bacterium]
PKKENKVDIVSGLDLSDLDKDVSDALIGLSFRDAKNKSILFAKLLNQNLRKRVQVRQNSHHSAGFVVLKNSNMASVLIELGFITNKTDSKNLQKKSYQDKFLKGASEAINKYFSL